MSHLVLPLVLLQEEKSGAMGVIRVVSLISLGLCCAVLGEEACAGRLGDESSMVQVVAEPKTLSGTGKKAESKQDNSTASQGFEKSHAEGVAATVKEPAKPVEVTATKQEPLPSKKEDPQMIQSMLDAWGNFLNGLLFG